MKHTKQFEQQSGGEKPPHKERGSDMKRTAKHLEDIRKVMNTSEVIQGQMEMLAGIAVEKGIAVEQWEEFKVRMMTSMLYKMAEMMPEIKEDLCNDIYDTLRA